MHKKQQANKKIRYCVLICQSLQQDYDSASAFAEIGNYPVIDYALNWLADNAIEEVFLFYSTHKAEIEEYCQSYGKNIDIKFKLNYMKPSKLKSFGDVMRQVRFRDLISQDFLVIYADSITNVDLSKVINTHFDKKNELRNVVLTTVMRRGQSSDLMILNSSTSQILQVEENGKQFVLNTQKVNLKKLNVDFRRDLVPVDMFVCTVDVLKSFKETEEQQTMNDFIVGMLTSEVYEQKIIIYELSNKEVALRTNRSVSTYLAHMNYISGYLFPYSFYSEDRLAKMHRNCDKMFTAAKYHKIYRKGAKIASSARLSNVVYLGQNSVVEQNCIINKSFLGKDVFVGKNSKINNCIILDGVKLGENSQFQYSLLEKTGPTVSIRTFGSQIIPTPISLITKDLFQPAQISPVPIENHATFEEQLTLVLETENQDDGSVVNELKKVKSKFEKSQAEFTKAVVDILAPKGIKGIEQVTEDWGEKLLKVHIDDQNDLMDSLYYACTHNLNYQKAFHLFLQYFYHYDVLSKQNIISWVKSSINDSQTLKLCYPFVEKLEAESQDEDEDDDS